MFKYTIPFNGTFPLNQKIEKYTTDKYVLQ